uniref:Uncharacterized protein n=1 Tax=Nelumbo nucifera TaxID=4432 RepID=A0A822XSM5_NELNU|nr:TPA_asm: hypothetical protein HUJ06_026078 [Nelumbo nucifera]
MVSSQFLTAVLIQLATGRSDGGANHKVVLNRT